MADKKTIEDLEQDVVDIVYFGASMIIPIIKWFLIIAFIIFPLSMCILAEQHKNTDNSMTLEEMNAEIARKNQQRLIERTSRD